MDAHQKLTEPVMVLAVSASPEAETIPLVPVESLITKIPQRLSVGFGTTNVQSKTLVDQVSSMSPQTTPATSLESFSPLSSVSSLPPSSPDPKNLAQVLLTLNEEERQVLQQITAQEVISHHDLLQKSPQYSSAQITLAANQLETYGLIRVLGQVEPDTVYILTDWAAAQLGWR